MRCQVITLARSLGSGGDEIARLISTELGFEYVDHEIVAMAAERAGVPQKVIEQAEGLRPFILRLLDAIAMTGAAVDGSAMLSVPQDLPLARHDERDCEAAIAEAIQDVATQKKVVIVGHGASIPLAGLPGLLRVFVTASTAVRAERVARERGLDANQAWKAVDEADHERAAYLRRFYDITAESPVNYDVVLNTDLLSVDEAADVVVTMARETRK